ncbi:MAG: ribonuclease J [Clostridia bacterium]|nr:ribonuclease J [Clostridia bacterium]MBR0443982.1 ribonuclease J [Clostridia bacterium]
MSKKLKIIPLGGMGEIGKNMTVLEYDGEMLVIDCGSSFPDESMPGIELVIPDFTYLLENRDRIKAVLITHGHEDHIGALPFLLKQVDVPVYGTAFAVALIRHKCEELGIKNANLITISPRDRIEAGCFRIEFIKTGHSIAGAVALAISTPAGTVIHTGDFKIDLTPMDGEPIDINRLAYYGSKGVFALLSDSTNVERPGFTPSELEIEETFERCFDGAKGRVIVATFASNIYRIQQIANVAVRHDRFVCFQGRSMEQIVRIAQKLGYLSIPEDRILSLEAIRNYPDSRICVMTTGSQGEPMSGLFRMAASTHKLTVGAGDTVVISASAIPGNERGVSKVIDALCEKGCDVIYDQMADVHVSGHACREELKLMLSIIKPRFFIPVHGEYRHLLLHARLAEEMGIDPEHIFRLHCGDVLELGTKHGRIHGSVPSGSVMVDGLGDMNDVVIKDRILLSEEGILIAVLTLNASDGRLLCDPQIVSRGFVYMRTSDDLIARACDVLKKEALSFENADRSSYPEIKNTVKSRLRSFLRSETHRNPMVLTIIQEVDPDGSENR